MKRCLNSDGNGGANFGEETTLAAPVFEDTRMQKFTEYKAVGEGAPTGKERKRGGLEDGRGCR